MGLYMKDKPNKYNLLINAASYDQMKLFSRMSMCIIKDKKIKAAKGTNNPSRLFP